MRVFVSVLANAQQKDALARQIPQNALQIVVAMYKNV